MKQLRGLPLDILLAALLMGSSLYAHGSDLAYSAESVAKGRALYMTLCTQCHGRDGKAMIDVVSNATNLTDPDEYLSGSDVDSILTSIRDGAGAGMPGWEHVLKDPADIHHLKNFILSLWPDDRRAIVNE